MKQDSIKKDPYLTESVFKSRLDETLDKRFAEFEEKMDKKFDKKFDEFFLRLIPILNNFVTRDEFEERIATLATKEDLQEVRDIVVEMDKKIDITFTFLKGQVDQNTHDIRIIQKKLNL